MLRLAQDKDIPAIVEGMLALKAQTGWSQYERPGYTRESLTVFLYDRLLDSNSVLYVSGDDTISAFCGGSLNRFYLPPHMLNVFEWGWFGDKRGCVECWNAVKRWGKRHGAELAGRVAAKPGTRPDTIEEHVIWKVI